MSLPTYYPIGTIKPGDEFLHNDIGLRVISVHADGGRVHIQTETLINGADLTLIFPSYGTELLVTEKLEEKVYMRYFVPTAGETVFDAVLFPGSTPEEAARHYWTERGGAVLAWPQTIAVLDENQVESRFEVTAQLAPQFIASELT